jgi:hypothetical protein
VQGFSSLSLRSLERLLSLRCSLRFWPDILILHDLPTRGLLHGLIIGCLLSALSYLVFWTMSVPAAWQTDTEAFNIYMKLWDSHRNRAMSAGDGLRVLTGVGVLIVICGVMVTLSEGKSWATAMMFVIISAAVSAFLYFTAHLVPNLLPEFFIRGMPGRLLNVHAYVAGPLLLGIALSLAFLSDRTKRQARSVFCACDICTDIVSIPIQSCKRL